MLNISEMNREPSSVIRYKRIEYLIYSLIIFAVSIIIHMIVKYFYDTPYLFFIYILPLLAIIFAFVAPPIRYRNTAYNLQPEIIEIAKGLYTRNRHYIPIDRIQYVDITQGPIARKMNLALITLHTNGSLIEIPYLPLEEAHQTADYINQRVKVVSAYV